MNSSLCQNDGENLERRSPAKLFEAYVEFMKIMLGNLFILNGGAAVALLAFLGDSKRDGVGASLVSPDGARAAIISFGLGATFATAAAAMAAWSENRNSHIRESGDAGLKTGFGAAAFVFIGLSVLAFMSACYLAVTLR